jgi:tetratricopeptide (TPR) repeat protein
MTGRRIPVGALVALSAVLSAPPAAGAEGARTFLILPFEDSASDPAREWLREGMAISLGDYLLAAGQQVVPREERLLAAEELGLPSGAPLTHATAIKIGRHLRSRGDGTLPDRLILGKFTLDDGALSLSGRVLDLTANRAGPWKQEAGNLKDLLRIQRQLAVSLLRSEGIPSSNLFPASDDARAGNAFPLVAYESYIRAILLPEPRDQMALLRKATQQSPGYPKAVFQLARILGRAGRTREAEAALKGIAGRPDPYGAEYHTLRGQLALDAGRASEAEEQGRTSLALKETAEARILLARVERTRGNLDRAREELDRAAALDPAHPDLDPLRRALEKETAARR